jgi:uncharacterized membrane protein
MSRHKYTNEELEQWRKDHNQGWAYFNKDDSNLFVPKRYGFGRTVNFGNPGAWIIIAALIALIVAVKVFHITIFG